MGRHLSLCLVIDLAANMEHDRSLWRTGFLIQQSVPPVKGNADDIDWQSDVNRLSVQARIQLQCLVLTQVSNILLRGELHFLSPVLCTTKDLLIKRENLPAKRIEVPGPVTGHSLHVVHSCTTAEGCLETDSGISWSKCGPRHWRLPTDSSPREYSQHPSALTLNHPAFRWKATTASHMLEHSLRGLNAKAFTYGLQQLSSGRKGSHNITVNARGFHLSMHPGYVHIGLQKGAGSILWSWWQLSQLLPT